MAEGNGTEEKPKIHVDEGNLFATIEKVMHPEIETEGYPITIYEDENGFSPMNVKLHLRALPIKQSRILNKMVNDIGTENVLENEILSNLMISITTHLFASYGLKGITKEIVGNSMDLEDMRALVRKQLEVCKSSDFLLTPVSVILSFIDQMEKYQQEAVESAKLTLKVDNPDAPIELPDDPDQKQLPAPNDSSPTPASASPGESVLTN